MNHTVCAVGTIQRRAGSRDHFNPLNVVLRRGDKVVSVHPQRGDPCDPIVNERQQRAGENIAESPYRDVGLSNSGV